MSANVCDSNVPIIKKGIEFYCEAGVLKNYQGLNAM